MIRHHTYIKAYLTALGFALSSLTVQTAYAKMFGEVEVGYSKYEADGAAKSSQETFYHRYALAYANGGKFKAKIGEYSYILGYEWGAVNQHSSGSSVTDINSGSIQRGHLLFSGDLRLAPPKYPVTFLAYSRDMSRIMTTTEGRVEATSGGAAQMISPSNVGLTGATSIESGFLFEVGVTGDRVQRTAPYFIDLPKIKIEYKNNYVSDLVSTTPQHNKSDSMSTSIRKNGLTLRYSNAKFVDIYNKGTDLDSSWQEQQFQVGTISNRFNRLWVDVTNWISISADGLLTKRTSSTNGGFDNADQYDINLFAIAKRETWSARTFNTFTRTFNKDTGEISSEYTVPLVMEGVWSVDSSWNARFSSGESRTTGSINSTGSNKASAISAAIGIQTLKRSPFTLNSSLSLTRNSDKDETTTSVGAKIETASTRRFSDKVGLFGSYQINLDHSDANDSNTFLQILDGRMTYRLNERTLVELSETISAKTGANETSDTSSNNALAQSATTNGDYIQTDTKAGVSWQPDSRLRIAGSASLSMKSEPGKDIDSVILLSNSIEYTLPEYKASARVQYSKRTGSLFNTTDMSAFGSVSYTPNQYVDSSVHFMYSSVDDGNGTSNTFELRQKINYKILRTGYNARKILELTEESSYEQGGNNQSIDGSAIGSNYNVKKNLSLMAKYFPYRNLFIGASARYSLLDPGSVSEWFGNATIGINYKTLQASIDYAYGKRNGSDNRIEKRLSANLKKQF